MCREVAERKKDETVSPCMGKGFTARFQKEDSLVRLNVKQRWDGVGGECRQSLCSETHTKTMTRDCLEGETLHGTSLYSFVVFLV